VLEVVEADLDDAGHAAAVVTVLDSYASDPIGGGEPLAADVRRRLVPELRTHPTALVLLALDGGEAVGLAVCFYGFSTFAARPLLNVHDLAVVPARRGQGIGRALLQAAEARARARGCCKLTLEVQDSNQRARLLYERFGFADFVLAGSATRFLTKPLEDGGTPPFSMRVATLADVPVLEALIAASARGLGRADYSEAQIEAALGTAWGVDSELIRDGTYFVVEAGGEPVACGGWSARHTLFGGDRQPGRESRLLDPAREAARVRAFFVRPDWARRGLGRALLARCESEAAARGFRAAELMATLPGERLYAAGGYVARERVRHPLAGGLEIEFVAMRKELQR